MFLRAVVATLKKPNQRRKIPLWVGHGLNSALQFLTVIVLARLLGPELLGQYAAVMAFTFVISRLSDIGLPSAVSYFIRTEPESAAAVSRRVLLHIVAAIPVMFLAAYGLRFIPFAEADLISAVSVSMGWLALLMLTQLAGGLFGNLLIATERYTAFTLLQAAPQILLMVAVYVVYIRSGPPSIEVLLAVLAVTSSVVPLLVALMTIGFVARTSQSKTVNIRELYAFGFRALPGNGAKLISARLDRMLLSTFLSASGLGLYSAGITFKTALLVPFQAYSLGLFNDLVDEKKAGRSSYDYNMRATVRWFFVMLAAGLVVFALAPYFVPVLFGPEFAAAVIVVRIVAFAPAFECVSTQVMQWLFAENLPSVVSRAHMLGATLLAASTIVGTLVWGVAGAACAVTLTAVFMAGYTLLVSMKIQAKGSAGRGNALGLEKAGALHAVRGVKAWDNTV
jgi:O-antigen/teichoic acid export membrane protein